MRFKLVFNRLVSIVSGFAQSVNTKNSRSIQKFLYFTLHHYLNKYYSTKKAKQVLSLKFLEHLLNSHGFSQQLIKLCYLYFHTKFIGMLDIFFLVITSYLMLLIRMTITFMKQKIFSQVYSIHFKLLRQMLLANLSQV